MLFNFLYNLALGILFLAYLPKALYQRVTKNKYQNSIGQRLGWCFPKIDKDGQPLIWIHAVSMGETKAIAALAKKLKALKPQIKFVISSTTETGHVEAKRCMAFADYHVYMPLDFSWIVKRIIKQASPDLVLLCESDFWYNFLRLAKAQGAVIALANGKISARSCNRLKRFPAFSKRLFGLFDILCVQGETYRKRFEEIGAPINKLVITGNLKFDDDYPALPAHELDEWKKLLGIKGGQQVIVAGSTHDPEEKLILGVLQDTWKKHPHLKCIIVPRHPQRFNDVAIYLEGLGIPFVRFSQLEHKQGHEKVILLDAMGLLRKCYQIADVAIVAGSYTPKVGGHNIIEPSWYGVPVIFGPHMHTQPDLLELVREYQTGLQVPISELGQTIESLLGNRHAKKSYAEAAAALIKNCNGATERTLSQLQKCADSNVLSL